MPDTLRRTLRIEGGAVETLIAEGAGVDDAQLQARLDGIRADDLASLVYTSGTTGRPKGCMLTHRNFYSEVRGILTASIGEVAKPGSRVLTFLPLAHVLARAVSLAVFEGGAAQAHWSDFGTISAQFERYAPNTILGVPRVFEKVRDAAARKAAAGGRFNAAIFAFAEETAIAYSESLDHGGPSFVLKAKRNMADKLVYAKLRQAMGGECWFAISGGGALSPRLGHFFRGVGVPIYEGYGLTESTAAHSVNVPGAQKIGTVGQPMGGNSTRIADDGEIELRGGVVFQGYWRNEKATAEAFHDGWFRTGDLGEIDEDGYVSITGRKKDLIITAGGRTSRPGRSRTGCARTRSSRRPWSSATGAASSPRCSPSTPRCSTTGRPRTGRRRRPPSPTYGTTRRCTTRCNPSWTTPTRWSPTPRPSRSSSSSTGTSPRRPVS